ncbi:DUF2290 domain-containing protein [Geminocystis sp. NIES-3709]|uniref:DUF2290 domain-containing protein n=1 Tax=Geminocystis sp. NIES-3709 TaxID=1617448 RepID=UPI0005FCA5C4|nr:DUF2290 domain-containing protein [Geminocystis sp. NIES-3709]BAQ65433.1 hypothetical protein GM3709_2198 [Geminocystis sp. NIES-3709]
MITCNNIFKEVQNITSKLIEVGLCDDQNYPSQQKASNNQIIIGYSNMLDLSIALKNISYQYIYEELNKHRNFNFKLLDGALIQILYTFQNNQLISHRLAFFPSPFLESFHNEPEIYEDDEIYADIIAKDILPTPIRFDYDPKNFSEIYHPKCHLTLGQFKNCRIPVSSPLTPNVFMKFILQNFYNTAFIKYQQTLNFETNLFPSTITKTEEQLIHISIKL